MSIRTVLFDLDGTLADSAPGILGSLRAALAEVGLPPLPPADEPAVLGPPMAVSLPPLIGAQHVPAVVAAYRRHYAAGGMLEARLYDGIAALVADLAADGAALAVATSKAERFAEPIVERLGLRPLFATVCGDTLEGTRGSKALVVAEALRRLGDPDPAGAVLVGDRALDAVGARENGIACLGAGWGYGTPGELEAAGVTEVYATPGDLYAALLPGRTRRAD